MYLMPKQNKRISFVLYSCAEGCLSSKGKEHRNIDLSHIDWCDACRQHFDCDYLSASDVIRH